MFIYVHLYKHNCIWTTYEVWIHKSTQMKTVLCLENDVFVYVHKRNLKEVHPAAKSGKLCTFCAQMGLLPTSLVGGLLHLSFSKNFSFNLISEMWEKKCIFHCSITWKHDSVNEWLALLLVYSLYLALTCLLSKKGQVFFSRKNCILFFLSFLTHFLNDVVFSPYGI